MRTAQLLLVVGMLLLATAPAAASVTSEASLGRADQARTSTQPTAPDPLSCVQRVDLPAVAQAVDAQWAPDSSRLVLARIVRSESRRTVTGFEEDPFLTVVDLRNGGVAELGSGMRPRWSGSGELLSFWRDGHLHVIRWSGEPVTQLESSVPDTRWVGEELRYFLHDEIRGWSQAGDRLISRVASDHMPRYPRDDTYFSADGELFAVTRYSMDGTAFRYVGQTATGSVAELDSPGATYTEWAPAGQTMLVRSDSVVELRAPGFHVSAPVTDFPGTVHGWAPDGRGLLMGKVSPTLPVGSSFDAFAVWEDGKIGGTATLPNLIGSRSFSPDGRYFAGIARTGLFDTAVEVYRCGTRRTAASPRAEPAARALQVAIDSTGQRFVRPVTGHISQFVQGLHTGIDISAPFGGIITAVEDGTVTFIGWVPVGGRAVCVLHYEGVESCYYHTSFSYVQVGQWVARGEPVAAVGMSGLTTGPHVHWEVKQHGRIVDPLGR